MKDLQKMTITIDRRQEHTGSGTIYSDLRVWIRMEAPEYLPGLRWISFLLLGDEGPDLFAGRAGVLADGYHHLIPFGELWTFCDLDRLYGGEAAGEAPIRYRRVNVPMHVQRLILADMEQAIVDYDAQGDKREEIRLDFTDRMENWCEQYGMGKGRLVVEGPEDEIEALKGEQTFDRSWATITQMALNTTFSKDETAPVRIYKESPKGFLWNAGRMHGGLINHGDDSAPDWSVHT